MTRNERIESIDPAIGSERNLTVDHLSSQLEWRAMRLQGRAAVPGLDILQGQAGSSEGPTSFVFCSAPPERKSVPDKLKIFVDALDDDDFEKRQTASKNLAKNATLKELVDLKEVTELTLEQRKRIERVTREVVENVWKKFEEDPSKSKLDSNDASVNDALFKYAPTGTFGIREATAELFGFVYQGGALRTVKQCNDHIHKSERIGAIVNWAAAAARKEGASVDIKNSIERFEFDGAWARCMRMRLHAELGDADPKVLSDAGKMTREERQVQARTAYSLFMEHVNKSPFAINLDVCDYLGRYLNDRSVPSAEFARTLETLTRKAISGRGESNELISDAPVALMVYLMAPKALPAAKAKVVERQVEHLSQDVDRRIRNIEDPVDRLRFQETMIGIYHSGNQTTKARKMYIQTLETVKLLPEEVRKDAIDEIKAQWGKHFDKK